MTEKKTASRHYRIVDKANNAVTFCKANNPSQAINYVTRDRFTIYVAKVEDVIGVDPKMILDATVAGVHPDQQKLPLDDDDKGGVFGGVAA